MCLLKFDLKVPKMRQMKSKLIQYIQEKRLPINVAMFKTNVSPLVVPFLVTQNFCTSAKWALFWKVVFYIESETTLIWQLLPKKDKTQLWLPVPSHFPYQTLPKAQRTQGLSSYHKFKHKSWSNFIFRISTKHHLQNLNQTSASP